MMLHLTDDDVQLMTLHRHSFHQSTGRLPHTVCVSSIGRRHGFHQSMGRLLHTACVSLSDDADEMRAALTVTSTYIIFSASLYNP